MSREGCGNLWHTGTAREGCSRGGVPPLSAPSQGERSLREKRDGGHGIEKSEEGDEADS